MELEDEDAVERLARYCEQTLGDPVKWRAPDGYPHGLALCVLDAIWSLGANYDRHVVPVLVRYRELRRLAGASADRDTASDLLTTIQQSGGPQVFADLLLNRQRTSTHRGAPLKAAAAEQAAQLLVGYRIDTPSDLLSWAAVDHDKLKRNWRQIPGQRSSDVGWRYFLLLAGSQQVKPDRMVRRYVSQAVGRVAVSDAEAARLLTAAATRLIVDIRTLDHAVWRYQSGRVL